MYVRVWLGQTDFSNRADMLSNLIYFITPTTAENRREKFSKTEIWQVASPLCIVAKRDKSTTASPPTVTVWSTLHPAGLTCLCLCCTQWQAGWERIRGSSVIIIIPIVTTTTMTVLATAADSHWHVDRACYNFVCLSNQHKYAPHICGWWMTVSDRACVCVCAWQLHTWESFLLQSVTCCNANERWR